jgi:hypothetical protein
MTYHLANDLRAYATLGVVTVAALLLLYFLSSLLMLTFGRKDKRCARIRRFAGIAFAAILTVSFVWSLSDYAWKVALRRTAHACESQASNSSLGDFTVERCYLWARHGYLAVYEAGSHRLLADRTYVVYADPKLIVSDGGDEPVVLDGGADGSESTIALPPSVVDRLRAEFP